MCSMLRAPEKLFTYEGQQVTNLYYVPFNHIPQYPIITMYHTMQSLHSFRSSPSKHTGHPVETIKNIPRLSSPTQQHSPLTTPKVTSTTSLQNISSSRSFSNPSPSLEYATTTTYYISLPHSTHNLAQTHIRQIYSRSQPPKQTTYISHATFPLKFIHLLYLYNALHIPCPIPIPDEIIYHYLHLTYQLRKTQHKHSLQLHTRQHTYLLTRTSESSDTTNSALSMYPYHLCPHLIHTHISRQGTATTTFYHSSISTTNHTLIHKPRTTTSLPTTDRTIILYPPNTIQNQHILLLVATHLILATANPNDIR